jgi:hypothetical protein
MYKLVFIAFLFLANHASSQSPIFSLESIQGSYLLADHEQQNQFQFNRVVVDGDKIILFLNDNIQEKYTLVGYENHFIVIEQYFDNNIKKDKRKLWFKVISIQSNELSVQFGNPNLLHTINLTKIN